MINCRWLMQWRFSKRIYATITFKVKDNLRRSNASISELLYDNIMFRVYQGSFVVFNPTERPHVIINLII